MSKVTIKLNRAGVRRLLQSPEMENALTGIAFARGTKPATTKPAPALWPR